MFKLTDISIMLILINWVTSWKNINIDFEDIKTTDHIMEIPGLSECSEYTFLPLVTLSR